MKIVKSDNLYDNLKGFYFTIYTKDSPHGHIPYFIDKDAKEFGGPNHDFGESIPVDENYWEEVKNAPEPSDEPTEEDYEYYEIKIDNPKPLDEKIFDDLDMVNAYDEEFGEGEAEILPDDQFEIDISGSFSLFRGKLELGSVGIWKCELADAKQNPKATFNQMMERIKEYIGYCKNHTIQEHRQELDNKKGD